MILRKGFVTTEFAMTVVSAAACFYFGSSVAAAIIVAGYSIARGVSKIGKFRFSSIDGVRDLLKAEEKQAYTDAFYRAQKDGYEAGRKVAKPAPLPDAWK